MDGIGQDDQETPAFRSGVLLREHHIFACNGEFFLADVLGMTAHRISPELVYWINCVSPSAGDTIPPSVIAELRRLDLVVNATISGVQSESKCDASVPPRICVADISLFVAQQCNMRCVYCYGNGGEYGNGVMMDESTAFAAVDWLMVKSGNSKSVNIHFFGGEPLLNFSLIKRVVSYAKERSGEKGKRITFGITTNGSLFTDEIIMFLAEEKINPSISFDGTPEYQNRHRPFKGGAGSYDKVRANVQKLRKVFPYLKGRATVTDDADPFLIKSGMEDVGFTTCSMEQASPVLLNAAAADVTRHSANEQRLRMMIEFNRSQIEGLFAAIRDKRISKACPPIFLSNILYLHRRRKCYFGCGIGRRFVAISATGGIYPCHRFVGWKEVAMGTVFDLSADMTDAYHVTVVDTLDECRSCWARYYCGGGCLYHNKVGSGDLHRPNAMDCLERKAKYEALISAYCGLSDDDREYLESFLRDLPSDLQI